MAEIAIEQATFERLQRHAKPLVDTTDSVLNRALDALEQQEGTPVASDKRKDSERRIDPRILPNLTHTKVLRASIAGKEVKSPNWNLLLDQILVRAMKELGDFAELHQLCPVNMKEGRKEDEGYGYLNEVDISVQGQDANAACRTIVAAAQGLGIALDVTFMWRPKENAAHPGERARIQLAGTKQTAHGATADVG